jgi:hypothetical protein
MPDGDQNSQGAPQEGDRAESQATLGIRIAFMDRRKVIEGICIFCNKKKKIFGFIVDKRTGKEGLACEGCLKSFF